MKQLLVEHIVVAPSSVGATAAKTAAYITEAREDGRFVVRLPATTLGVKNENQRTYSESVMEGACRTAKSAFEERSLLSSVNEHPAETPYVTPGLASHIVTRAWCENGFLMNEWDVLDTAAGKDLRALIEGKAAFGVSIRGLGSIDNYGNILDDYEYLGTDCVAQPSARLRTAPQVVESTQNRHSNTTITEGITAMDLRKYVREQITLLRAEPNKVDAFRRAAAVESYLSESKGAAPKELSDAFREWEDAKTVIFEEAASAPNADAKVVEAVEAHRKSTKLFKKVMADSTTRISGLEARVAESTKLLVKERASKDVAVSTAKSAQNEATATKRELALLRRKYEALVSQAAEHKIAAGIAVTEAARHLSAYRVATKIAAQGVVENAKLKKGGTAPVTESARVVTAAPGAAVIAESKLVRTVRDPQDGTLRESKQRSRGAVSTTGEQPHAGWL